MNELIDEIGEVLIKAEKINEIHNSIFENYFMYKIDYDDKSSESQLRIHDLCVRYQTYTTLLEIGHDYIAQIMSDLNKILTRHCEKQ